MELGTIIGGRYKLLRHIGAGGMGAVYLAEDIVSHKRWAVKHSSEQEYRLLDIPRHAGIPMVIDCVEEEDGIYMVMEYAEGLTLQEYLEKEGKIPEEQAVKWIQELAVILRYLHSLNPAVFHLDIKPSNIILGKRGKLTLLDLGAAMEKDQTVRERAGRYGTFGYAPPEQRKGRADCDARSDIYALGMTLSYMLTGINPAKPPFGRVQTAELTKGMKKIIEKCTAPEKEERFQNMEELLEALRYPDKRRGKKPFIRYREKSSFHSAKQCAGLLLLAVCILAGSLRAKGQEEPVSETGNFVIIRNEIGQKILLDNGVVYPVEKNLRFEIPGEYLKEGIVYEVEIELRERTDKGRGKTRILPPLTVRKAV